MGDFTQRVIIFWLDATDQHGLVCSKQGRTIEASWRPGNSNGRAQARGNGIYAGKANTSFIIAAHVAIGDDGSSYAALNFKILNEFYNFIALFNSFRF